MTTTLLSGTLAQLCPQLCLRAGNWPHVGRSIPLREADLLAVPGAWVSDEGSLHCILVGNPSQLYGFVASTTTPSSLTY